MHSTQPADWAMAVTIPLERSIDLCFVMNKLATNRGISANRHAHKPGSENQGLCGEGIAES